MKKFCAGKTFILCFYLFSSSSFAEEFTFDSKEGILSYIQKSENSFDICTKKVLNSMDLMASLISGFKVKSLHAVREIVDAKGTRISTQSKIKKILTFTLEGGKTIVVDCSYETNWRSF